MKLNKILEIPKTKKE
uniref:Uncharacterized protein n=1 Tax=Rhizophora mucronata TaxID=61149 RepID=A0A2P2PDY2_RHIMU